MDLVTYALAKKYIDRKITDAGGVKGDDGLTPFIGENGNWWIGTTDTGVAAASNVEVDGKLKVDAESNTISVVKGDVETTLDLGDKTDGIDIEYINKLFAEGE